MEARPDSVDQIRGLMANERPTLVTHSVRGEATKQEILGHVSDMYAPSAWQKPSVTQTEQDRARWKAATA